MWVKVLEQYVVFGNFDFISIVEVEAETLQNKPEGVNEVNKRL